jgi:hypothetical protein
MKKTKVYFIASAVLVGIIISISGFFWNLERPLLLNFLKDRENSVENIVVVNVSEESFENNALWPWGNNWVEYLITYIMDFKPKSLVLSPDFVSSAEDAKGFNRFLHNPNIAIPFDRSIGELNLDFKSHMFYGRDRGLLYSFYSYRDLPNIGHYLKDRREREAPAKKEKIYFTLQEDVKVIPAASISLFGMLKREGYRDDNISQLSNSFVFLTKDGGSLLEQASFLSAFLNNKTFSVLPVEFIIYIGIFLFLIIYLVLKSFKFNQTLAAFSFIFFGWIIFQRFYFNISRTYIELIPISIFMLLAFAVIIFEKEYDSRVRRRDKKNMQLARLLKEREVLPNAALVSNGAFIKVNRYKTDSVGGDFYQFLEFSKGELGFIIGWVPGIGIERVEYIMDIVHSWRDFASIYKEPNKVVQVLNNTMFKYAEEAKYATLVYGLYDAKRNSLKYVNAGHNPLIFLNGDGNINILTAEEPTPLGIARDVPFKEVEIIIKNNAMLIGYSGGITEVLSGDRGITDDFLRHLKGCLKSKQDRFADDIFKEFLNCCSRKPEEEWSLLTLKITT